MTIGRHRLDEVVRQLRYEKKSAAFRIARNENWAALGGGFQDLLSGLKTNRRHQRFIVVTLQAVSFEYGLDVRNEVDWLVFLCIGGAFRDQDNHFRNTAAVAHTGCQSEAEKQNQKRENWD